MTSNTGPLTLEQARFAVVDVETTGMGPQRGGRILEVAVAILECGTVHLAFDALLDPGGPIPPWVTALTGITDGMAAGRPRFADLAADLRRTLEDGVFVAHNARFDWRALAAEWTAAGLGAPAGPPLCTIRLTRRLVPELRHRGLDAVAAFFGVANPARHRAFGDALTTARILRALLGRAAERGVETLEELIELHERPRRMRNVSASAEERTTSHCNSAFRIPHSGF
jgi:DNA polymerase III epsilon subunit family exonuclease